MPHRIVTVTEFKAKCLAMLDDVHAQGGTLTITRRGQPLAQVGPARQSEWKSPEGSWVGKVALPKGLLEADTSGLWDVVREGPGSKD